jgi:hypothetical protein
VANCRLAELAVVNYRLAGPAAANYRLAVGTVVAEEAEGRTTDSEG